MNSVREASEGDISALYDFYHCIGKKDEGYFEHALERGKIYLVYENEVLCAFCVLNWKPRYSLYKKLGIPEIQDINVLPEHRRKGIATHLIKCCEDSARAKNCEYIGLSVGLSKDYGPAQILYAKLGYIPDGNGITYDRQGVDAGKSYPMDDDLALMLLKKV